MTLKKALIKLGSTNPELRKHLRPVLSELDSKISSSSKSPKAYLTAFLEDVNRELERELTTRLDLDEVKGLTATFEVDIDDYEQAEAGWDPNYYTFEITHGFDSRANKYQARGAVYYVESATSRRELYESADIFHYPTALLDLGDAKTVAKTIAFVLRNYQG